MNNYSETNTYFYRTTLSLAERDMLIFEKKTPLSYSKEAIPLVAFSHEIKVIKNKISTLARWLLTIEFILIIGFFINLYYDPSALNFINIPIALIIICVFVVASIVYYVNTTKNRQYFYYENGTIAFSICDHKKKEQKNWINEFTDAVHNAKLNYDQNNFAKIRIGIDSLEKQNLISKLFAEELCHRLYSVANTKIN